MPQGLANERIVSGSCGAEHSLLVTAANAVVVFGDNTNHQCTIAPVVSIMEPLVLCKEEEFGIPGNHFVDEVRTVSLYIVCTSISIHFWLIQLDCLSIRSDLHSDFF